MVKFENSPKNLEDRKHKAPLVSTRKQFKVAFGTAKGFELAKDQKISEAYLHNANKRCTILFRGSGAFTFSLKEAKHIRQEAKYDLTIGKKNMTCNLRVDLNKDPTPSKKAGFKIKGTGEDNGKEFTLKSEYYEFDKEFLHDWTNSLVMLDGDDAGFEFKSLIINRDTQEISGNGVAENGSEFTIEGTIEKSDQKGKLPVFNMELTFTNEAEFHQF